MLFEFRGQARLSARPWYLHGLRYRPSDWFRISYSKWG